MVPIAYGVFTNKFWFRRCRISIDRCFSKRLKISRDNINLNSQHRRVSGRRMHDDVIKWNHFPRYWPFVRGIQQSPVNSPHKGQWRGALMFCLICARLNGWVNNREAGDLRRHHDHYDVTVMFPEWVSEFDISSLMIRMGSTVSVLWSVSIGSDDGFGVIRRQAIIWTTDDKQQRYKCFIRTKQSKLIEES